MARKSKTAHPPIGKYEFIGHLPDKPWIPIRELAIHQVWLSMSNQGISRLSEQEFERRFVNYRARWYYAVQAGLIHAESWYDVSLGKIMDAELKVDGQVKLIERRAALEYILGMRSQERSQRREKDFGMGVFNKTFVFNHKKTEYCLILVFAPDPSKAVELLLEKFVQERLMDSRGYIRSLDIHKDSIKKTSFRELQNSGDGVVHII